MGSPAQIFLALLEEHRDRLYSRARAASGIAGAEPALAEALRIALPEFAAKPTLNALAAVELRLGKTVANGSVASTGDAPPSPEQPAMPADMFARLTAVIQVAAEESIAGVSTTERAHFKDPLLAPKKHKRPREPREGLGLSPLVRFLLAAVIALVVGVIVTLVILGR